jgi:Ig-like domain from next to BRCA1 gene
MTSQIARCFLLVSCLAACETSVEVARPSTPPDDVTPPAPDDDVTPPAPDDVTPPEPDDVTPPPDDVTPPPPDDVTPPPPDDVVTPPPADAIPGDHASVVSHTLPATLGCNQRTTITVTMRNTGDTTWTADNNYRLGAVDDSDPFFTNGNRVTLGSDSVAPGQEHTFNVDLAGVTAGTFTTDWQMVHDGVQWFGDAATSDVDVACNVVSAFYPCVIDGQFNMPEHEQRIASRNAALIRTGHTVSGNDDVDNAVLGGGAPDGGIWLSGQFHFEVDAGGQIVGAASWITVFSAEHFPVTGGIYANGEIHMGSPVGVDIAGLVSNATVTGKVAEAGNIVTPGDGVWNALSLTDQSNLQGIQHGNDIEYVHGVMSGSWTAR